MPFGERVLYMLAKDSRNRKNALEMRYEYGIWAGLDDEASETVTLTQTGKKLARSVRRLIEEHRYDNAVLDEVNRVPWDRRSKESRSTEKLGK